jgi:hypothetical protein
MNRLARLLLPLIIALGSSTLVLSQSAPSFVQQFPGTPPIPQPYDNPDSWDIFVNGFNSHEAGTGATIAQHGPNCEPPGFPYTAANSHHVNSAAEAVFICNNHLMTGPGLSGYSAIYLTPPALADFSNGSTTISWNMSTLRSSARDWVDVVITPLSERSSLAYNNNDQHIPPHNIHVTLAGTNVWQAFQRMGGGTQYGQGQDVLIPGDGFTTWDAVFERAGLQESPARRDQFQIVLSRTHISVCMPGYQQPNGGVFCWINTNLLQPLDPSVWNDQAVVQWNHRVYNAEKACNEHNGQPQPWVDEFSINHSAYGDLHCPPDTWHWSDFSIQPAAPMQIINSVPQQVEVNTGRPSVVSFAAPAPANASLSFVAFSHTPDLQVSFDQGQSWSAPHVQPANAPNNGASEENGEAFFTPIPQGVQQVMMRGTNGFWGSFYAGDFAIYAGGAGPNPRPTRTPVPTATPFPPTATPVSPTDTPVPLPTLPPPTLTAVPTFTPLPEATATPEPTQPDCTVSVSLGGTPRPYVAC